MELTLRQKKDGCTFIAGVLTDVGQYLARGIETANKAVGISDRQFWWQLFVPTNRKGQTIISKESLPGRKYQQTEYPPNPYRELDLQACNKYLLFGWEREYYFGGTKHIASDSKNFFTYFGIPFQGNGEPVDPYRQVLYDTLHLKNEIAYATDDLISKISYTRLKRDLGTLKLLTKPLSDRIDWCPVDLPPLNQYWSGIDQQFAQLFAAPVLVPNNRVSNPPLNKEQARTLVVGHILVVLVLTFFVAQLLVTLSACRYGISFIEYGVAGAITSAITLLIYRAFNWASFLMHFIVCVLLFKWLLELVARMSPEVIFIFSFGLVMAVKIFFDSKAKKGRAR